uniref:Complement component C7 n=1 Tax=Scophthalmus maximus TaxID=52904 RepID=A0A8D3CSR3_SCOMX
MSVSFVLSCQQPVTCRWGSYGEWSECDGCTSTKVRTRHVEVFGQFGGAPCSGDAAQTQPCVPQKKCPLQTGCGDRFRCTSGQCISHSLVCNGDQDCDDGLDERGCEQGDNQFSCDLDKTPPNSDFTGRGYDVLTGKLRAGVINTLSFGGQCRKVFSGDHKVYYRLPQSILRYNFEVKVDNEESDESYDSSWSYMQHMQSNALVGHDRRTFHKELTEFQTRRLIILKNKVELAQFQNSAPQYLTLSEGFWKALSSLPFTYDYSAYRRLLQTYGTHYLSEGSLGGEYQGLLQLDRQALTSTSKNRFSTIHCHLSTGHNVNKMPIKVNIFGGDPSFIGALTVLDLENPEANGEIYDNWASSVKDFPEVVDQKLRPLHELVKEVQCAGLKKLHLRRATDQYLAEEHPCHCRPCRNNGQPLLSGSECRCVCRPGTSGGACEVGAVIGEQPGVTHGSWSCWSSWGTCSGGRMSRTRSCNNPAPSGGGHHCTGLRVEQKPCEDPEIQYLQTMEPQCFSLSVTPPKKCGPPPNLRNGFIQVSLQNVIFHYSLVSQHIVDVIATPANTTSQIGDRVSLSCPAGSVLEGEVSEVMCSPSLQWSPSPADARCRAAPTAPSPPSGLKCKPWENVGKAECVCKMPFQCSASLQLCARLGSSQTRLLGVCQLGALQCVGRSFTLTNDSDCKWPEATFTSCEDCEPGTVCQGEKCVCQNASECRSDSAPLCVNSSAGSVATTTMTECEVGARRCAGEQVNVIAIEACPQ